MQGTMSLKCNLTNCGIFSLLLSVVFFMFQILSLNNDIKVMGYKKSLCICSGITFVLQTSVFYIYGSMHRSMNQKK